MPLCGGIPEAAPYYQIGEMARLAAAQLDGTPKFLHVPYLLAEEARKALSRDAQHPGEPRAVGPARCGAGRGGAPAWRGAFVGTRGGDAQGPGDRPRRGRRPSPLLRRGRAAGAVEREESSLFAIEPKRLLKVPLRIGAAVSQPRR